MEHPITPPDELVAQWLKQFYGPTTMLGPLAPGEASLHVAVAAARWGANQELEACCEWMRERGLHPEYWRDLRDARRPKPPSEADLALAKLTPLELLAQSMGHSPDDTIRRALERLKKLEGQGEHAPGPEPLSPAAQVVLDAYFTHADLLNREVSHEEMIAAALRALADQLRLELPLGDTDADAGVFAAHQAIYSAILTIATELEAAQ